MPRCHNRTSVSPLRGGFPTVGVVDINLGGGATIRKVKRGTHRAPRSRRHRSRSAHPTTARPKRGVATNRQSHPSKINGLQINYSIIQLVKHRLGAKRWGTNTSSHKDARVSTASVKSRNRRLIRSAHGARAARNVCASAISGNSGVGEKPLSADASKA